MIPILVLKTENKVIYNTSNLNCKTFFEEFSYTLQFITARGQSESASQTSIRAWATSTHAHFSQYLVPETIIGYAYLRGGGGGWSQLPEY